MHVLYVMRYSQVPMSASCRNPASALEGAQVCLLQHVVELIVPAGEKACSEPPEAGVVEPDQGDERLAVAPCGPLDERWLPGRRPPARTASPNAIHRRRCG